MGFAVGNLSMEEKQIQQNIQMSVNFLVSLLKKNRQNEQRRTREGPEREDEAKEERTSPGSTTCQGTQVYSTCTRPRSSLHMNTRQCRACSSIVATRVRCLYIKSTMGKPVRVF